MNAPIAQAPATQNTAFQTTAIHTPGFADPVNDAQRVFRAVLEALARPATAQQVDPAVLPPAPLSAMSGAIVLALCDEYTPIWLDDDLRRAGDVETWIRFHAGATIVDDPADAMFCVVSRPSAVPELQTLRQGTDEEPQLSATVIIDAADARSAGTLVATGPGVNGQLTWDGAGLPSFRPGSERFLDAWAANNRRFPCGVDLVLAGDGEVRGISRTTALSLATGLKEIA